MANTPSESSRPEKLVRVNSEDIFGKPLTKRQREELDKLAAMPDSEIGYTDIPPLTEEQLANAFRPRDKQLIAVRLDRDVLAWVKGSGEGYSKRLNSILRTVMEQQQAEK